jgi:hypothetical protein
MYLLSKNNLYFFLNVKKSERSQFFDNFLISHLNPFNRYKAMSANY